MKAKDGEAQVPVECSTASRCATNLALRPIGANASSAHASATAALPRPVKARTARDVGRKKLKLGAGAHRKVPLRVRSRRGKFELIVAQSAGGRTIAYAVARIRVR